MSAKRRLAELESAIGKQQDIVRDIVIVHAARTTTAMTTCHHDGGKSSFTANDAADAGEIHGEMSSIDVTESRNGPNANHVGVEEYIHQQTTAIHETSNVDDGNSSDSSCDEDYVTVADGSSTIDGRDDDIDDVIDDIIDDLANDIRDVVNDVSDFGEEEPMNLVEKPDTALSPMSTATDQCAETSDRDEHPSQPGDSEFTVAQCDDRQQHHSDDADSSDHRKDDASVINPTTSAAEEEETLYQSPDYGNSELEARDIESSSVPVVQETTYFENVVENDFIVEDEADVTTVDDREQADEALSTEGCDTTTDKHHQNPINSIADMFQVYTPSARTDPCSDMKMMTSVITNDDVILLSGATGSQQMVDADTEMASSAAVVVIDDEDETTDATFGAITISQELAIDEMDTVLPETPSDVEHPAIETSRGIGVSVEPPDNVTEVVTYFSRDGCIIEPPPIDDKRTETVTYVTGNATRYDLLTSSSPTLDVASSSAGAVLTAKARESKTVT